MSILILLLINVNYWVTAYGTSAQDECAFAVEQTSDGGYIMAGTADHYGDPDGLVIKTNNLGDFQWARKITDSYLYLYSVRQTSPDLGYIVGGEGNGYFIICKLNPSGTVTASGGFKVSGMSCYGYDVQQTTEGGYVMTGTSGLGSGDVLVIKFTSGLSASWGKTYGVAGWEVGRSIRQTADGGYLIGGYTSSGAGGGYDFLLIKTDGSGNVTWANTYGGTGTDMCYAVTEDYVASGMTKSFTWGGGEEALVIKVNSADGSVSWAKNCGSDGASDRIHPFSIVKTPGATGGEYALCGEQWGPYGWGFTLFGLNAGGVVTNLKKMYDAGLKSGSADFDLAGKGIDYASDGGYIMAGSCKSPYGCGGLDFFLMKTTNTGAIPTPVNCDFPNDCCPPKDGIVAGMTVVAPGISATTRTIVSGGGGSSSVPVIVETDICTDPAAVEERGTEMLLPVLSVIPSISKTNFKIKYGIPREGQEISLKIYDLAGKVVKVLFKGPASCGMHTINWTNENEKGEKVNTGVYFCELYVNEKITRKIIVIK